MANRAQVHICSHGPLSGVHVIGPGSRPIGPIGPGSQAHWARSWAHLGPLGLGRVPIWAHWAQVP